MPRFFFHIRENGGRTPDEEGLELPDLDAARQTAIAGARSIMCDTIMGGRLSLDGAIEVKDKDGALLFELPFREAVEVPGIGGGEAPAAPAPPRR